MLTFFTDQYDDELISSIFGRYHFYSGNIDKNDTIEELQGERNIIAFSVFPSRLKFLESQIENSNYSADNFIYKNTIFPIYSVFLSKAKQNVVINYMKYKGSDKIYTTLGMYTSNVDIRTGYKYCPMCVEEEKKLYGEAYFHRTHQVPGVLVCEKHECCLVDWPKKYRSEIEFTRLEYEDIKLYNEPIFFEKEVNETLFKIAKSEKYIMNLEYLKYNKEFVSDRLYELLDSKEYITVSGKIKQSRLSIDLRNYYNQKVLRMLNSEINLNRDDWIRTLLSKSKSSCNPVRTILLILFLTDNNIHDFFNKSSEIKLPFGKGSWPCLNPICTYYKQNVIDDIKIEKAYKSRLPNAILKCKYCAGTHIEGKDRIII